MVGSNFEQFKTLVVVTMESKECNSIQSYLWEVHGGMRLQKKLTVSGSSTTCSMIEALF